MTPPLTPTSWSIPGVNNAPILGNTHPPTLPPTRLHPAPQNHQIAKSPNRQIPPPTVLLCHGFKGYKDYGFFPLLATRLAQAGFTAIRFNFSHSGMTNNLDTFDRPDLFEQDTWLKQVEDLKTLTQAVLDSDPRLALPQHESAEPPPIFWFGHSRGGDSVLLAQADPQTPDHLKPTAIVTAAAPKSCLRLDDKSIALLERDARLPTVSYRTGQTLQIGKAWLDEQRKEPHRHDPLSAITKLTCPARLLHGTADPTVPITDAHDLLSAAQNSNRQIDLIEIKNANHTFDAPNPLPPDTPDAGLPENTRALIDHTLSFFIAQSSLA